jgi:metallophosphoesterase superfamily enzyme
MGHQHPMVSITDAFGRRHRESAWVVAPCDEKALKKRYEKFNKKIELVMMPAFNPLVGNAINIDEKGRLGPILNNNLFKLNRALVFRLDGTCLGQLENIF